MKRFSRYLWLVASLAVLVLQVGCAAPPVEPRVLWPPPPDEPRFEFVGNYASQKDFPKTGKERLAEAVVGTVPQAVFRSPVGIASDGKGKVFVSDFHDRNVRLYDFNQRTVRYLTDEPVFTQPIGLTVDKQDRLFVADGALGKIFVFTSAGNPLFSFGSKELIERPTYLAINERLGRLYVSDSERHRIVVFDLEGNHLFGFGEHGGGEGQFFAPQGVAIDKDDQVFVADLLNARIEVFDAEGNFVRQFGERGDQVWQFENPKDLAFDADGNLHIIDSRKATMLSYNADGDLLLATGAGRPTQHALGFSHPTAIFIDQNSRVYISEMLNKRFSIWQYLTPAYLETHPITPEDLQRLEQSLKKVK